MNKTMYGLCFLCCIPLSGYAASFDCSKAVLAAEKKICAVRSLNDADVRMVTLYQLVLRAVPMGSRDAEKDAQYQWLKQRNRCGGDTQCIAKAYQQRQAHLEQIIENRVLIHGPF